MLGPLLSSGTVQSRDARLSKPLEGFSLPSNMVKITPMEGGEVMFLMTHACHHPMSRQRNVPPASGCLWNGEVAVVLGLSSPDGALEHWKEGGVL
jgi:hypothetical protein